MANSDLNEVMLALSSMSEMLLTEHGEFYPIGVIMFSDGDIQHIGAKIEDDDHSPSQSLIDTLTKIFKEEARKGKLRAAGICYDVLTIPPANIKSRMPSFAALNTVSVKP